jgi:hypothetical protein
MGIDIEGGMIVGAEGHEINKPDGGGSPRAPVCELQEYIQKF